MATRLRLALAARLLLLPLLAVAGCARPSASRQLVRAMTYARFTAADTTRAAEWRASEARAAGIVAPWAERVRALPGRWHLLVVAELSCGDAIHSVPYLAALDSAVPTLELRLLRKEAAPEILAAHELDGRQATPVVVLLDARGVERGVWIERPQAARAHLAKTCTSDEAAALRAWREGDGGRSVLEEVTTLVERAARAGG